MKNVKFLILTITACCIYHSSINAQIKLIHYVLGNGAATVSGGVYTSSVTIGQPIIGSTSNTLYSNNFGFWYQYNKIITDVEENINNQTPKVFQLFQNYPNPFNPTTVIEYQIPDYRRNNNVEVTLIVYDVLGRELATLVNEQQRPGYYEVEWDASNLTSGVYFYNLRVYPANGGAGSFLDTKKMILMK